MRIQNYSIRDVMKGVEGRKNYLCTRQEGRLLQAAPARGTPPVHRRDGACEEGKEKVMKLMVKPYLSAERYGNTYQDTMHKIDIKHKYYGKF